MDKISIIKTEDHSHTLFNEEIGEHYHSTYGAIQESKHVFIQAGLDLFIDQNSPIHIFEVGFGTGLNALLSFAWAEKNMKPISYHCVELYPVSMEQAKKLNYPDLLGINQDDFLKMHESENKTITLPDHFSFQKKTISLQEVAIPSDYFNLVFFDAFSPDVQPEMWTEDVFGKISLAMKRGGVLTTYSCKGVVKRALKAAGFEIEKLPGPKGKREILRAIKT